MVGHSVSLGAVTSAAIGYVVMWTLLDRLNTKRDRMSMDEKVREIDAGKKGEQSQPPLHGEAAKLRKANATGAADDAFFPLTMPFTTGPGTISVAVALGANRPPGGAAAILPFFAGVSAAAAAVAATVWLAYSSADRLTGLLGEARARVVSRLAAFLMLCVGTKIALGGVTDVLRPLLAAR